MKTLIVIFFVLTVNIVHARTIINSSNYDTEQIKRITSICLEVLNIDSCIIFIKEMPAIKIKSIAFSNIEVLSTVVPESDIAYSVYLAPGLTEYGVQESLIHELIHVKQYYKGELRVMGSGVVEFRGKIINLQKVPYKTRPFEVEARRMEQGIQYFIKAVLTDYR